MSNIQYFEVKAEDKHKGVVGGIRWNVGREVYLARTPSLLLQHYKYECL